MRVLALVLPWLPAELARRTTPELATRPLALVERRGGSLFVTAASPEVLAGGVPLGASHAQALATVPDLVVRDRRLDDEREGLRGIARWASLVLAPRAGVALERHAVLVEVSGVAHVHGTPEDATGERAVVERALSDLRSFGHAARGAIADTVLGALAVALEAPAPTIVPAGETAAVLQGLSPRALGLAPAVLATLASLGVRTLGELASLPRRSLPVRFGDETLDRLDRALGKKPERVAAARFPRAVRERLVLDGATDRQEVLLLGLEDLARRTVERLSREGRAPRGVRLAFSREDAAPVRFSQRLAAPVATGRALARILRPRVEQLDLSVPVLAIELVVEAADRAPVRQGLLFSARDESSPDDLACLLARLEGVFGARRVLRPALVPDHRPERAFTFSPVGAERRGAGGSGDAAPSPRGVGSKARAPAGPRPTRLLERPRPIPPPDLAGAVGPERIETGFWEREVRRDYWVLGGRWVFRDLETERWFVHGVYD